MSLCQKPWEYPDHVKKQHFYDLITPCRSNSTLCSANIDEITDVAIRIGNTYCGLLVPDIAQSLFQDAFYYVDPKSTLGYRLNHMLAVLSFSQGDLKNAEVYWNKLNHSDTLSLRSLSAQVLMKGNEEKRGMELISKYTATLVDRLEMILEREAKIVPIKLPPIPWTIKSILIDILCNIGEYGMKLIGMDSLLDDTTSTINDNALIRIDRKFHNQDQVLGTATAAGGAPNTVLSSKISLLNYLLSEARGLIHKTANIDDIKLASIDFMNIKDMGTQQRFSLAVGLAKLGLFDLSLRHVWLSATPWEAPLYLFRAKLVFSTSP